MKTRTELDLELVGLKKQHSRIHEIEVLLDDTDTNTCVIFIKHPDRMTYSQVSKFIQQDIIKGIEVFVRGTYVGGDPLETITSNDYALRSLDNAIAEIMYVKQSSLKKN